MLLWLWRKWASARAMKKCHHGSWIVLEESENIWWRNIGLGLEYYEGKRPNGDFTWRPAQRKKCGRCGGMLDEITYGKAWLATGMNKNPHVDDSIISEGCGSILDANR